MHRDAFHVVDLVGEIGLDQHSAVDQRVRLDAGERNAADAHGDAARRRKAALEQQQISGRQNRAVADVEIVAALDGKARDPIAVENIGAMIALRVEAVFGDYGDQLDAGEPFSGTGGAFLQLLL